jgi:hypothetical protein
MNDDSDCDGVLTATDCDDADPAITFECIVVSSGGIHSCAVLRSGEVACWGIENVPADNDYYEQGQAT